MNICILSGSARKNNNTIRLAYALQELLQKHEVSIVDFVSYDIPLVPQGDLSMEELTPFQKTLMNALGKAQLVFLISPEYNWSTTPEILNMLHRLGEKEYKHVFDNKVFALAGVSSGKGGKAPALHLTSILNKIISFLNLDSIVSPRIFESHYTENAIDEQGNLQDNAAYRRGIEEYVKYSVRVAERWFHITTF